VKPDEYAVGKVMFDIDLDTTFLVVVGSGSLSDLTRYISSRTGLPFVVVATAASMDGYASTVAPILQGGFKRTPQATYPYAIIVDVDVLCQAPYTMTTAGFSDLIGKLISRVDWELSAIITGEYYCDFVVDLVNTTVNMCVENALGIKQQDPDVIAKLAEGLILSGIGMLVVGNSRPASGSEHHLAHYWEMKSFLEHHPQHFHGTKVGVATGIMAKFYEKFFSRNPADIDIADIKRRKPSPEEWEQQVRAYFGPVADGVLKQRQELCLNWDDQKKQIERIQAAWEHIQHLQTLKPTFERVREIQEAVGGSILPEDIDVDQALLRETLLNAKDVRPRYTVIRAAEILGWLEEIADEVVNEYDFGENS
jgi:glycerol-1-phosphate dehydrogenase [NAD(P)+]